MKSYLSITLIVNLILTSCDYAQRAKTKQPIDSSSLAMHEKKDQKKAFNNDSSTSITLAEFDKQIDDCILLLQSKQLKDIFDRQHIQIMMCLNTIFMGRYSGGHYDQLEQVADPKNYGKGLVTLYKEWIPNRGFGYYFPALKMELYGTPRAYAIYNVTK